ncbi:hypothetical protein ACPW96_02555 [Micromonospora sp. DT81.3]|uniref:hypothetical protein n=1 Tax=Micromonospora sp. DT81.3 TaxID=3416523 RepID=UPI003CF66036
MGDGFIWRAADVASADWSGTAQLDQRRSADFAQLAGLDSEKWLIVGFDIRDGDHGHELRVVAVDRDLIPEAADVFPKIAAEHGGQIPATEFLVHDVEPYEVLQAITRRFELRLRARGTKDLPIRIIGQSEGPEQPFV